MDVVFLSTIDDDAIIVGLIYVDAVNLCLTRADDAIVRRASTCGCLAGEVVNVTTRFVREVHRVIRGAAVHQRVPATTIEFTVCGGGDDAQEVAGVTAE